MLYRPRGDPAWGLYDAAGEPIAEAVDRGLGDAPLGQALEAVRPDADAPRSEERYLYLGRANLHYGHFLVETLCRCWPLLEGRRGRKLLVHGDDMRKGWGGWQGHAVIGAIFERLGVGPQDLAHFDAPVTLAEVEVGEPAMRQQAWGRPLYRQLCLHIGDPRRDPSGTRSIRRRIDRLLARSRPVPPTWLSRSAVYSGTATVKNEPELEAHLRERGWAIAHPEQMPFEAQLDLFRTGGVLAGFVGSAFHTNIFTRRQPRRIILSMDGSVNANFALFDKLAGRPAEYYATDMQLLEDLGPGHGGTEAQRFTRTFGLGDPAATADALQALIA